MCFTPIISLSTFVIEFIIATFILIRYKNYIVPVFWASFIYVLGFYQFTEFMLCVSTNQLFWAKLGFATFNFIPAIGLHFGLRIAKINFPKLLLYIPPVIYAILAFNYNFIIKANCSKFFTETNIIFNISFNINSFLYGVYYFGYLALMCFILIIYARKVNKLDKKIIYLIATSILLITLIPIILVILLPSLNIMFPSIYCEFAILFSIVAIIACQLYDKKKKKEKGFK